MKTENELQRAHDLLHFLGSKNAPAPYQEPQISSIIRAAQGAIGYAIDCPECGARLDGLLKEAWATLEQLGYQEVNAGEKLTYTEARRRGLLS